MSINGIQCHSRLIWRSSYLCASLFHPVPVWMLQCLFVFWDDITAVLIIDDFCDFVPCSCSLSRRFGELIACSVSFQRPPSSSLSYPGPGNEDVRSPGSGGTPGPLSQQPSSQQSVDNSDPGKTFIVEHRHYSWTGLHTSRGHCASVDVLSTRNWNGSLKAWKPR